MKERIRNIADWKYAIPAFTLLGLFAWYMKNREFRYLSDKENVRYTITKVFEFKRINLRRDVHGHFFYNGKRQFTKLVASCRRKDCSCDIKLNDYLWVKFNINKPSIYEVLPPCEFKPLKDSIPIPKGGIKEEMLKFYAK